MIGSICRKAITIFKQKYKQKQIILNSLMIIKLKTLEEEEEGREGREVQEGEELISF